MNFNCKKCNKKYSSYQSLWNHKNEIIETTHEKYNCDKCNKILSSRQSKWRHMKICKIINNNITNNGTINNNTIIINNYMIRIMFLMLVISS